MKELHCTFYLCHSNVRKYTRYNTQKKIQIEVINVESIFNIENFTNWKNIKNI